MERPLCATCVHFVFVSGGDGRCTESPAVYVGDTPIKADDIAGWSQPMMSESSYCGQHPAFKAYLASLGHEKGGE